MPGRLSRRRIGLAGVLVGGAVLWIAGLVWFRPWIAHNDFAIFRIALERELNGHIRVVGAHSRLGVFHPGPLREWVFALPYWFSGRRSASLPATALVLNAGWVVWTLAVLARLRHRHRPWGVAGVFGLALVVVALGADIGSPWNPHLAIVPAYLACWSLVTVIVSDGQGWVACLCSASFAAQLHASMLIVGGAVLVAALVTIASRRDARMTAYAVGVALLLWSGPIIDLRRGADANLVRLGTVGADGDPVGWTGAVGHVSRLLWPGTPWQRISVRPSITEFTALSPVWLLTVVVVLGAAVIVGRYVRPNAPDVEPGDAPGGPEPDAMAPVAGLVALGGLTLTVVSVSLFVEPVYRYLYGPLQGVAVFSLAVAIGGAVTVAQTLAGDGLRRPSGSMVSVAAVAATGVAVLVISIVFVSVPRRDGPSVERSELGVEGAVTAALERRPGWRTIEAVPLDLIGAGDLDAEVLDVALRRGVDARSRRVELGLDAPDQVDGVFAVAMSAPRDCLLAEPTAEEIIRGTSTTGATFSVVALDRNSIAYDRCIGLPVG